MRSDCLRNILAQGVMADRELTIMEHQKNRLLVSNDLKDMCMKYDLKDITPISLKGGRNDT